MDNKFTPSVNLIRDFGKSFNYLHTPNSERVFEQLDKSYSAGIHSFSIIGSFGTGKSSFLLAFEKQLNKEQKYFEFPPESLNGSGQTNFINIVGSYSSITEAFLKAFEIDQSRDDFLNYLDSYYQEIRKKKSRLVIVVDEFGKFLEYAAANNPEKELYFVQQVAEFANDVSKDIIFITTLHQNFQAYTSDLDVKQRREWEKVKGRFKEIAFNEPVEQLLFLAAKYLNNTEIFRDGAYQEKLNNAILKSNVFPLTDKLIDDLSHSLLPLDMVSASVLTLSLQRYGQNERSLFYFLQSNDVNGITDYDISSNPYYNTSCVYDYLIQNYYYFLSTRYNPDHIQWIPVRSALERAEPLFKSNYDDAAKIIKTIGLLNIFASKAGRIDLEFLSVYAKLSLGINDPETIIEKLNTRKIIRYREFQNCYVIYEGTDLDIDLAVKDAAAYIERPTDIVPILKEYFRFPFILAKANFFETGTPRFYEIIFSNQPIIDIPNGDIDGIINLIFNQSLEQADIVEISSKCKEAILFGLFKKPDEIIDIIWEIERIKFVIGKNPDDKIALKELNLMLSYETNLLNRKIHHRMFFSDEALHWYFKGEERSSRSKREFNVLLSEISKKIYPNTPHFKNELINRHVLPSSMPMAKKRFVKHLVHNWREKDLGFPQNNFPPEKTIYLGLLKSTKIHSQDEDGYMSFSAPENKSFKPLWKKCDDFLENAKKGKKSVADLIDTLSRKPFGLKYGFLEFWLPVFLFANRDSFALFRNESYVPVLGSDILFLIVREPEKYFVKTFDIAGIRLNLFNNYRQIVNKASEKKLTNVNFIDTIRPFLTFYNSLPDYTKKTNRLSTPAIALRDAISKAKDPEKAFFEDFPNAFDYTLEQLTSSPEKLEEFIRHLKEGIQEIKTCFEDLLTRIETFFKNELGVEGFGFPKYKSLILGRYKALKEYLLLPHQKAFFIRLNSELDDRISWLKSIIQAVLGKSVEMLEDHEEEMVFKKFSRIFFELDNLCEFSEMNIDRSKEEALKLEITTLSGETEAQVVRYQKKRMEKNMTLKSEIEKKLSNDKQINIAVLLNLLREQLYDE